MVSSYSALKLSSKHRIQDSHTIITVVTAYFDIGPFQKGGSPKTVFTSSLYLKWAKTFKYLVNPLVVYTDSREFQETMQGLRSNMSDKTRILLIDRNSSWAFQRREQIAKIYAMKNYPRHYPNTVIPEYACAQHAKYDLVSRSAKENYFRTIYYAWLDIGYFRNILKESDNMYFTLQKPPKFNNSKIAMNVVSNLSMSVPYEHIFRRNAVWVGGGLFLGQKDVVVKYEEQYNRAVDYFITKKLMNTDQQINYAMFSKSGRDEIKPTVEIQLYSSSKKLDWFYLGYLMRKTVKDSAKDTADREK